MTLKADSSMRERAYQHILRKIALRELRPGSPVAELPVARELNISRTPTREALRQLISEGLLEEQPGRGAIVPRLTREDLIELYGLREALETHSVQTIASTRLATESLAGVRKISAELAVLAKELRRSRSSQLNREQMDRFEIADIGFHAALLRLAGNRRAAKAAHHVRQLIRIYATRHAGHTSASLLRIHRDHEAVLDAIERGKPAEAAQLVRDHIRNSREQRLEEFDLWERQQALDGAYLYSQAG